MWKNKPGRQAPVASKAILLLIGLAIAALAGSCTEEPPPYLAAKDRELIDTLYVREVRILRPQLDSLCAAVFEEEVQRSVDSMLSLRRSEEARLRARIKLDQQ